jgi:hypothetical protein
MTVRHLEEGRNGDHQFPQTTLVSSRVPSVADGVGVSELLAKGP